jgi:hypothetical protein
VDAVGEQPEDQVSAATTPAAVALTVAPIARVGTLRKKAAGSSVLVSWLAPTLSLRCSFEVLSAPRTPAHRECCRGRSAVIPVGRNLDAGARCVSAHARAARQPSGCPPDVEEPICSGPTALAAVLGPGRPRRLRYGCTRTSEFRCTRTSEFGPRGVLEQALLPHLERRVPEPPAAALEAVVAGVQAPSENVCSTSDTSSVGGPPRSRSNGSAVPWADVGRILRRRGPALDR